MRVVSKDRQAIRDDALRMMRQKAADGCESCARQFEAVARDNGASDADVASAKTVAWDTRFTRRTLLQSAVVATGGAIATSGLLRNTTVKAATGVSTAAAWTVSRSPSGAPPIDKPATPAGAFSFTGYGTDAGVIGALENVVNTVAYTNDGCVLAIVSPCWAGNGFQSRTEICDGRTGARTVVIHGATIDQASGCEAIEHIEPFLSPDGSKLALARMHYDIPDPGVTDTVEPMEAIVLRKRTAGKVMYQHAVEVIDLGAKRSLGMIGFDPIPGHLPSGEHIAWAPDSLGFYLFSRRYQDPDFFLIVTRFDLTSGELHSTRSATSRETGNMFAVFDGSIRHAQRVTPDGTALVRYTPGRLGWYSLNPWSVRRQIERAILPGFGKRPPLDVAIFSAEADRVFFANGATGELSLIDTSSGATVRTGALPRRPGQSSQPREPFDLSTTRNVVALSKDEKTLYISDNRGLTGGVWTVDAASLKPTGLLFEHHTISAVVVSPFDATIYGLSRIEGRLYHDSGSTGSAAGAMDFLRPGSIGSGG
jgi:hypothetical protein